MFKISCIAKENAMSEGKKTSWPKKNASFVHDGGLVHDHDIDEDKRSLNGIIIDYVVLAQK